MPRPKIQKKDSEGLGNLPDSSTKTSTLPLTLSKELRRSSMKSRHPNCALCQNHGKIVRTKGHKRYCPWRECNCEKCNFTKYRRKVVASQIAVRRAMIEDQEREKEMMENEDYDEPDVEKDNCSEKECTTDRKQEEPRSQLPKSETSTSFSPPHSSQRYSFRDGNLRQFQEGLYERSSAFFGNLPAFINSHDRLKSLSPESIYGFQSAESTESVYHIRESIQTLNNMFCLPYDTQYPIHRIWHDFGGNFKLAASKIFEAQYGTRNQPKASSHLGRYSDDRTSKESTNEPSISRSSDIGGKERLEF